MEPTQLNAHQRIAIEAGATKLFTPIEDKRINKNFLEEYMKNADLFLKQCFILDYSPYQVDETYFMQEVCAFDCGWILYQSDFSVPLWDRSLDSYQEVGEMVEDQSQIKFKVIGVEIRNVQDLSLREMVSLGVKNKTEMTCRFVSWYNKQYPEKPYSQNSIGFLVTVERIM